MKLADGVLPLVKHALLIAGYALPASPRRSRIFAKACAGFRRFAPREAGEEECLDKRGYKPGGG